MKGKEFGLREGRMKREGGFDVKEVGGRLKELERGHESEG